MDNTQSLNTLYALQGTLQSQLDAVNIAISLLTDTYISDKRALEDADTEITALEAPSNAQEIAP